MRLLLHCVFSPTDNSGFHCLCCALCVDGAFCVRVVTAIGLVVVDNVQWIEFTGVGGGVFYNNLSDDDKLDSTRRR